MDFINAVSSGPVADSTISVAHDCGSGADRWLLVAVPLFSAGETPTVASVAYDGAALSPVVQGEHLYAGNTNVVRAEWWTLDVAAAGKTGSANIVVTLSGAADQLSVIAFTATGSGGPSASVNTAGGNLGVYSVAVNTAAATSRVVGLASLSVDRGVTPGSGNTLIEDVTSATAPPNNILAWVGWEQGTGGSDTWDVTLTSAVRSAAAVIELLEAEEDGEEPVEGALDAAIGDITLAATGTPEVAGAATQTLAAISLSAQGAPEVTGDLAAALGGFALAAAGAPAVEGELAAALDEIVAVAAGSPVIEGAAGAIIGAFVLAAAGDVVVTGELDVTLPAVTLAATGSAGVLIVQVYSASLPAQPSPGLALKSNVMPGAALGSQPSPAVEAKVG